MKLTWDDVAEIAVFSSGCYWIAFVVLRLLEFCGGVE